MNEGGTWALVLAAGDGRRLHSLTTDAQGVAIPKQYCSLHGGPSLLEQALLRARSIAVAKRVCMVVAEQHRCWWSGALADMPEENVIVQPENRGTAIGILLPLLHILERDPQARIVLLPSDHHLRDEHIMALSLAQAASHIQARDSDLLLLGIEPEEADPGFGYIMPGFSAGPRRYQVTHFVEKPDASLAQDLIDRGALWNAFIVATLGNALLQMFDGKFSDIVMEMRQALLHGYSTSTDVLSDLYSHLPVLDFSRDIIKGQEAKLQVLATPPCGWSDLGTPKRVAEVLRKTRYSEPLLSQAQGATAHFTLAPRTGTDG
jgi:mannose-1-phosphate guanylyltransferase